MGVDFFKLFGAAALLAVIIWVIALRAERDQAKAEAAELAGVVEAQGASIAALEQDKKAASAALTEWQAKNAQITRDLERARKATLRAAVDNDNFAAWADNDLPDAIFVDRLLTDAICANAGN